MSQIRTVAYIIQIFPFRTETFISREVQAMRDAGIEVITLANQQPHENELDVETVKLRDSTQYVFPMTFGRILAIIQVHLWWLVFHFKTYMKCLPFLTQEESRNPAIHIRNIKHFFGAVYLAYQIRSRKIDHIHTHYGINASTMALVIGTLLDIPFTITIHNIIFTDRTLFRLKLQKAQHIVCISDYSRKAILEDYPDIENLAEKMPVVHCGIHADDFVINPTKKISQTWTIMTACQLVERKGVRYLIEACHLLIQSGYDIRCIIAGTGEDYAILKALSVEYGIANRIDFIGVYTQEEMLEHFAGSQVFVLPCVVAKNGDRDGIPIVLMEAMAAGTPVISTHVSGIPELINHTQNGMLVPEKDAKALAQMIQEYIEGNIPINKHIASARTTILEKFNMQKSVAELIDLFNTGG